MRAVKRSVTGRIAGIGVAAVLLTGALAPPVTAGQEARSIDPEVTWLQETPEEVLRGQAREAREAYAVELAAARAQRAKGLAVPRATRAEALRDSDTKEERRLARRAYARSAAPVIQEYRTAKQAALAERDAAIDGALAEYLQQTGQPAIAEALKAYRDATAVAGATLELAMTSGRDTLRTDTADERAQLVTDLEEATTEADRQGAWLDFQAASADDRSAYERSVLSARATYASAMSEARRAFRSATDVSIKKLLRLPFKV